MTHPALDERTDELVDDISFHERYEKALADVRSGLQIDRDRFEPASVSFIPAYA